MKTQTQSPRYISRGIFRRFLRVQESKYGVKVIDEQNRQTKSWELQDFFDHIFYDVLCIDPSGKAVLIGINLLANRDLIEMIMSLMLRQYKVKQILFLPTNVLPLYMTASFSGLVVDCGFCDTQVSPIFDGQIVKKGFKYTTIAGLSLLKAIIRLYKAQKQASETLLQKMADIGFLNDLALKYCQVLPQKLAKLIKDDPVQLEKLAGKKMEALEGRKIGFDVFALAAEEFFSQEEVPDIVETILDAILDTPKQLRKTIVSNVVLCGGGFLFKGLIARLQTEILDRVQNSKKYKSIRETILENLAINDIKYPCNLLSWSGTQIFSESLSCGNVQFIDLNTYEKDPQKVNTILSNYFFI